MVALLPGDLLIGFMSENMPVWRAGSQIGELDSGYPHDATHYNSDCSGFTQVGSYIYATRYSVTASFITNAIQKFDLTGAFVADIFTETVANTGTGGALTTREFLPIAADSDGNLWVGIFNTIDFVAVVPDTVVYLLEKYDTSGTLLGQFLPVTLADFDVGSTKPLVAAIQSLSYEPISNQLYYAASNFTPTTPPTEVRGQYIHKIDASTGGYNGQFYNAGVQVFGVTIACNNEVWATLQQSSPSDQVLRLSSAASLISAFHNADMDIPYQIAIDADGEHFWIAGWTYTEDDPWQLAYVDMATSSVTQFSVPTSDHGPLVPGEMSMVWVVPGFDCVGGVTPVFAEMDWSSTSTFTINGHKVSPVTLFPVVSMVG